MNTATYIQRMAELGIDRGQLATKFRDETTMEIGKVKQFLAPFKPVPPPFELEDLSWMNPHNTKKRAESIKKAWASMDKNKYARCVAKNRAKGKLCRGITKSNFVRAKY